VIAAGRANHNARLLRCYNPAVVKSVTPGAGRPRSFKFTVPLVKLAKQSVYILEVPKKISVAVARRGPVPIVATLNNTVEVQVSMVPMGGGRHWLQLNARIRQELGIEPGDRVRVVLLVPEKVPVLPMPTDLSAALQEVDLQETFARFPAGKQNHILLWIEEAAHPQTRERRIALTIEVTFRARERAQERSVGGNLARNRTGR
jgi:Domain of unknown function (DUF1905)/Bacteriocin-protection, YdeI or OmpD-Associated